MANWDVIVIGLGGVGSAAAARLAARGCRVLGIDQFEPVHKRGSSHGRTRMIRQAYFEHPAYVPLLRRAYELWDELERQTDQRLFHRTGLAQWGPADGVVVPGVLRSAAEHGLQIEEYSASEATRRWPAMRGDEVWKVVVEPNAGYLRVEACVSAHLELAARNGATLRHGQAVAEWRTEGDSVVVVTDQGEERAERLVIAAGPWSRQVLGEMNVPLQVLRKHQYWFAPTGTGFDESSGFPCFFHETPYGYFYGFPSSEGSGVKVARHDGGQQIDGPTATHPADPVDQEMVQRYLSEYLPGIGSELREQAGCYYTMTPDENFVVDCHPEHQQVVVVAGLSGHGFKFASVLGELACQLAMEKTTSLDTSLLSIQR